MAPAAGAAARGAAAKEEAEWRIVLGGLKWVGLCAEQVGGGMFGAFRPPAMGLLFEKRGRAIIERPAIQLEMTP